MDVFFVKFATLDEIVFASLYNREFNAVLADKVYLEQIVQDYDNFLFTLYTRIFIYTIYKNFFIYTKL